MIGHAAAAFRNAFQSPGFRRFGVPFARDYLRFAWSAARRWGDTGPGGLRWMGHDVRFTNRTSMLFLLHEIFAGCAYDFEPARPDPLIVDGGANLGMSVLFFRMRFPQAQIVAVEPHPEAFRLMEENTRGLGDGIERIRAALTEDGAPATLIAPPSDGASLMSSVDATLVDGAGIAVEGLRLSDLIARQEREIDYLKLDVEGAEYGVVRDLVRTGAIARVREAAIEYHRTPAEPGGPDEIASALRDRGFDITVAEGISGADGIIRGRRRG
jgi:FkbM family methyltransferase